MAVTVNFYTFNKKQNSTKQPTGTGTSYSCLLREPCDVLSPTIALDYGKTNNPSALNYCYIASFNRYYYIDDWTYDTGLWYASCSVDALASWKTSIGNSEQYILRSTYLDDGETKVFNGKILDTMYPTIADIESSTSYMQSGSSQWAGWQNNTNQGTYVVGVINSDGGTGAVSYYVFTPANFDTFKNNLINSTWWDTNYNAAGGEQYVYDENGNLTQNIKITAAKAQINPLQYIASCMWFPFDFPSGAAVTSVPFGWFNVSATCNKMSGQYTLSNLYVNLEDHPQITRGSYLNQAPYTRRELYFYNWGTIPIDTTLIADFDKIYIRITVDGVSGIGVLSLLTDDGSAVGQIPFYRATTMVGVPIQLAQLVSNNLQAFGGLLQVGLGAFAMGASGGILGAGQVANGISSVANSMLPQLTTSGSQGSVASYRYPPSLSSHFTKIAEEHYDHLGRPYCHSRDVYDLSGYMQIGDADVDFACTPSEKETIINNMEGGFFYE